MSQPITRDELEEKAEIVVDYTVTVNEEKEYFRPHTKNGVPDTELMLDIMGLEVGAIYELRSERLGDTRGMVTERPDNEISAVEDYTIERGALRAVKWHARDGEPSWDAMQKQVISQDMDDNGASPVKWWQAWFDGRLEVIGHIGEVAGGWPDRSGSAGDDEDGSEEEMFPGFRSGE